MIIVRIDELLAVETTYDATYWGHTSERDEAYFHVSGTLDGKPLDLRRVSPPPPEDYYGLRPGEAAHDIVLWVGKLLPGQLLELQVTLKEQDFEDDDFLGGFFVRARREGEELEAWWQLFTNTSVDTIVEQTPDHAIVMLTNEGGRGRYQLRSSVRDLSRMTVRQTLDYLGVPTNGVSLAGLASIVPIALMAKKVAMEHQIITKMEPSNAPCCLDASVPIAERSLGQNLDLLLCCSGYLP